MWKEFAPIFQKKQESKTFMHRILLSMLGAGVLLSPKVTFFHPHPQSVPFAMPNAAKPLVGFYPFS